MTWVELKTIYDKLIDLENHFMFLEIGFRERFITIVLDSFKCINNRDSQSHQLSNVENKDINKIENVSKEIEN